MKTEAKARVIGKVTKINFVKNCYGEKLYEGIIAVKRISNVIDYLPFLILKDKLHGEPNEIVGQVVDMRGEIRARRYIDENGDFKPIIVLEGDKDLLTKMPFILNDEHIINFEII